MEYLVIYFKQSITNSLALVSMDDVPKNPTKKDLYALALTADICLSYNNINEAKQRIEKFDQLSTGDIIEITGKIKSLLNKLSIC